MKKPLPDRLNICLVADKFPLLGRAADHGFLWPIAKGLARKGHKVTVLSWKNPQGKPEIDQEGVKAYFLGEPYALDKGLFPEMIKNKFEELHQTEPFDIVHSIDHSAYLLGKNKKQYKVAMTYDVSATQMAQLFSILGMAQETLTGLLSTSVSVLYKFLTTYYGGDRALLKSADAVFVTSPIQKIVLERYYLYPEYRTYSIPYGIEIGSLSPRESSDELREKLGIPSKSKILVTITDMSEFGEIKNLLYAFSRAVIKKPASRFIIVGNGPLRKEIEFEMLNLALGNKVIFTGSVTNSELPNYIALADTYVNLSARTSGFEPSTLEAMAQKKIIIGSEVSPISTIVEDGVDGFLIRPGDVGTLTTLLIQIFSDQLASFNIGENARQKILDLFDSEKMVEQTINAYYETLAKTRFYSKPKSSAPRLSPAI